MAMIPSVVMNPLVAMQMAVNGYDAGMNAARNGHETSGGYY